MSPVPHKIGIGYSEKAGWKKIAVSLPEALYARIRMRAVDENRSMSEMIAHLAELGFRSGGRPVESSVRPKPVEAHIADEGMRGTVKAAVDLLTMDPPRRLSAIKLLEDKLSAQKEDVHGDRPNDCPSAPGN